MSFVGKPSSRRPVSLSPPRPRRRPSNVGEHPGLDRSPDGPPPRHSPPAPPGPHRPVSAALPGQGRATVVAPDPAGAGHATPSTMSLSLKHSASLEERNTAPGNNQATITAASTAIAATTAADDGGAEATASLEPRLRLPHSPSGSKLLRPLSASKLNRSLMQSDVRPPRRPQSSCPLPDRSDVQQPPAQLHLTEDLRPTVSKDTLREAMFYCLKISILLLAIATILMIKAIVFFGQNLNFIWNLLAQIISYITLQLHTAHAYIKRKWGSVLCRAVLVGQRFHTRALSRRRPPLSPRLIPQRPACQLRPKPLTQPGRQASLPLGDVCALQLSVSHKDPVSEYSASTSLWPSVTSGSRRSRSSRRER